jgi:nonsense-mediated mRNA decay protein 3
MGNIAQLGLCHRIGSNINVIDPSTFQISEASVDAYYRYPFRALASVKDLVEYQVLDVEPVGNAAYSGGYQPPMVQNSRFLLADITVAKSADFGKTDSTVIVRSHLGGILKPGDLVLG